MADRFINSVETKRLATYVVVGGGVSALYAALVAAFVELAHLSPIVASLASFVLATPVSYLAHASLTFGDRPQTKQTPTRFFAVTASAFTCAVLAMYMIHDVLKMHYGIGILVIWVLIPIANYAIHRAWTFRERDAHDCHAAEKTQ